MCQQFGTRAAAHVTSWPPPTSCTPSIYIVQMFVCSETSGSGYYDNTENSNTYEKKYRKHAVRSLFLCFHMWHLRDRNHICVVCKRLHILVSWGSPRSKNWPVLTPPITRRNMHHAGKSCTFVLLIIQPDDQGCNCLTLQSYRIRRSGDSLQGLCFCVTS